MKGIKGYKLLDCCLIKVCGENVFRFLSVCVSLNVDFYEMNLHSQDNSVDEFRIYVKNKDVPKLKEASTKTGIGFTIIKELGALANLRKFLRRKMLPISISIGIVFLYILTLFVWQIQINGCVNRSESEILDVIKESGAGYGILKRKCDCEAIEEAVRNQFDDVLWVSASIRGTGLFVQIKENTYLNDKLAITDDTADLTADKDGVVVSIVTRTGVPKVKIGDEVKKGDILISGVEEFYNDAAEVYKTEHVYADGDVVIERSNTYTWQFKRNIKIRRFVGKKTGILLKFFDKRILNLQPDMKNKKYEESVYDNVLVIGNDFYLPVNTKKTVYKIYEYESVKLSDSELKTYAGIRYKLFCAQEAAKGVDIIEKNAKIKFNDSECTVTVNMKTHEICGTHTAITVLPIEELTEEESTD